MMKNKIVIITVFWVTFFSFVAPIKTLKIDIYQISNNNIHIDKGPGIPVLYAQDKSKESNDKKNSSVEKKAGPAEDKGMLIKVMLVVLVVWFGVAFFLFKIDRRISKLESELNEL